jgi:type II secretory pathway pseudopilin PulG
MAGRRARPRGVRAVLWGPAEYPGRPPVWLVREGVVVGLLGTLCVVGCAAVARLAGVPAARAGAGGVVCALALTLYLLVVRAGRVLVGAVAVLGVLLALLVPQVTADIVMAERGQRQEVVVTAVRSSLSGHAGATGLCSFAHVDGVPLTGPVLRGCRSSTAAGDRVEVLFDPAGVLTPRAAGTFDAGRMAGTVALALALPLLCLIAVVRSYRLTRLPLRRRRAHARRTAA